MKITQSDWIENTGVAPEGNPLVVLCFKSGVYEIICRSNEYYWKLIGDDADIIAYCIVEIEPYKAKRWRAVKGGEYWFIDGIGAIDHFIDNLYHSDDARHAVGNYFRTREEAEADLAAIKKMRGVE